MSMKKNNSLTLTPRRMEILQMIDKPKMEIAMKLKIDVYTVRDHIRALRKAGVIKGGGDGVTITRKVADKRRVKVGRVFPLPDWVQVAAQTKKVSKRVKTS